MSVAKWIPQDGELDSLARSLPPDEVASDHAEQNRTRVLVGAASVAQQPRSPRLPMIVTAGFAFAAAAAALVWVVGRNRDDTKTESPIAVVAPRPARDTIVASAGANFERVTSWPDARVRVHEGRVSFEVPALRPGERYRVVTADAEVEVRGTRFLVEARQDRLTVVLVEEGIVEVRMPSREAVSVTAGQRWSPPRTAQLDPVPNSNQVANKPTILETPAASLPDRAKAPDKRITNPRPGAKVNATPVPSRSEARSQPAAVLPSSPTRSSIVGSRSEPPSAAKPGDVTASRDVAPAPARLVDRPTAPVVAPALPAKPGEAEFRRGWALLRGGDPSGAAKAFASACNDLGADALSEDACYWTGAAAKRAGQTTTARDALTKFIGRFPSSLRAAEASALLGWLLYEAGDLPAAEARFKQAAKDRAPKVRASAERGLEAIKRSRDATP